MPVWSTTSPEYGTRDWLRREVAINAGMDADAKLLNQTQREWIDSIVESGVMQFAYASAPVAPKPPEAGDEPTEQEKEARRRAPHRWSFLTKVHQLSITSGTYEYDLPSDFSAFIGEPTTSRSGERLAIVREAHLRQLVASEGASDKPNYCALRKKSIGGSSVDATEILLYPIPDANETIQVEYQAVPQTLDADNPYPPGGKQHAETLLAFCLYVLAMREGKGLEAAAAHAQERLSSSIVMDRQASKPTADGVWIDDDGKFNYAYLSRMIGLHLGFGPNRKAWSHQQTQMIAEILRRTLRRVYNPPLLPNERYPHDWSFLRPKASITLEAGTHAYDLPSDFAMLYGPLTHATDSATLYPPIRYVGEEQLRQLLQREETSARPDRAAIRVKDHDDTVGTRYEILFWPVPDEAYEIDYRYRINPDSVALLPIDDEKHEIHGGNRYSEMFLEAAMLTADEMNGIKRSPHWDRFYRCVMQSVGADRLQHAPDNLGYNGDVSDYRWEGDHHDYDENIITYNGVAY